uniref:Apple domain-containing protein n=1 Tax=Acrobeloides nanus TaxID=290746 RepID=A0A914DSM1_9BILA
MTFTQLLIVSILLFEINFILAQVNNPTSQAGLTNTRCFAPFISLDCIKSTVAPSNVVTTPAQASDTSATGTASTSNDTNQQPIENLSSQTLGSSQDLLTSLSLATTTVIPTSNATVQDVIAGSSSVETLSTTTPSTINLSSTIISIIQVNNDTSSNSTSSSVSVETTQQQNEDPQQVTTATSQLYNLQKAVDMLQDVPNNATSNDSQIVQTMAQATNATPAAIPSDNKTTMAMTPTCLNGFQQTYSNVVPPENDLGSFNIVIASQYFLDLPTCQSFCARPRNNSQCVGFMYDPINGGACTLFMYKLGGFTSAENSSVVVYERC